MLGYARKIDNVQYSGFIFHGENRGGGHFRPTRWRCAHDTIIGVRAARRGRGAVSRARRTAASSLPPSSIPELFRCVSTVPHSTCYLLCFVLCLCALPLLRPLIKCQTEVNTLCAKTNPPSASLNLPIPSSHEPAHEPPRPLPTPPCRAQNPKPQPPASGPTPSSPCSARRPSPRPR